MPNRSRNDADGVSVVTWNTRAFTILNPGSASVFPALRAVAPAIPATHWNQLLFVWDEDSTIAVYSKSADVIGAPSLHRSPGRSVNVYVRPSGEIFHDWAMSGCIWRLGL